VSHIKIHISQRLNIVSELPGFFALNGRLYMNDKLESIGTDVAMTYFKILSQYSPSRTEENHFKNSCEASGRLRILTNTCATILRIRMWKYFTYLE
jgi:hypothetical protein